MSHVRANDGRDPGLGHVVIALAGIGAFVYTVAGLPRIPSSLPAAPGDLELQLELLVRNPTPEQQDAIVSLLGWAFWMGWTFVAATVLLRIAVIVLERVAEGTAWVRSLRWLSDLLTLPMISRAVDASMAGTVFLRVALATPDVAVAHAAPLVEQAVQVDGVPEQDRHAEPSAPRAPALLAAARLDLQPGDIVHIVRSGESLVSIAEDYFGDPDKWKQIHADNHDRPQPHHGSLQDAGKIYPEWLLVIRGPTHTTEPPPGMVDFDADGQAWHTVRRGESLWGISDGIYGDGGQWPELYVANKDTQVGNGHVLDDPDVIWPEDHLRVPWVARPTPTPVADAPVQDATTGPGPAATPVVGPAADRSDPSSVQEPQVASSLEAPIPPEETNRPEETQAQTPPSEPTSPTATPAPTPAADGAMESRRPLSPEQAAVAAAGSAAVALAAGHLVVRRRRPAPIPTEPASDVHVSDGFAEADPVHDLARRLAHTADPATVIAGLLGQAYLAIFDARLHGKEREEASRGLSVAATRHGRTSTTLVLAAPVLARPHLVRCMRDAAVHAFGEHVDVDGQVDQNGDVLVRVTWHPRRPLPGHLLERVDDDGGSTLASAWPVPCLVPALVLHDRQHLAINWHTLHNVLVATPTGQGADVPLVALVAALASVRAPEDLGLIVVAQPHTLPDEIGLFPHGLNDVIDTSDPQTVLRVLESVKVEVDRRRQVSSVGDADLVVVIRELAEIEPDAQQVLGSIAAGGPEHGVQLVVASDRPVAELLNVCSFVDQLGTRLVLQAATEEDSVALLGMPGAERLGAGGYALLRLEGRLPVPGWAYRLPADRLARLVHMMGTRAPVAAAPTQETAAAAVEPATDAEQTSHTEKGTDAEPGERLEPQEPTSQHQAVGTALNATQTADGRPQTSSTATSLLSKLRAAPLRVRCFGAGEVWYSDRLLELRNPELLLLFGVHPITGIKNDHPITGIKNETLADMLFKTPPADIAAALRKERYDLRKELRRLVPEVASDPLPGDEYQGEKVVVMDLAIVSSDVHEFDALREGAKKLEPPAAIEAYEAALRLYRGDLLDNPAVLNYRWMYDDEPQVALTFRSDYRLLYEEARLRLAELLANGPEAGLARAEELYLSLCAEHPDDERLWIALFRIHERTGSALGLKSAVKRLRGALAELGTDEIADVDSVPLPRNLDRLVQQIRQRIGSGTDQEVG